MYISEHSRHGVLLIHQILREYLFAFVCSLGVSFSASQALCWKGEQTVHSYLLWTDYSGPTDLCHIPSQSPLPIWEVCLPSHIPCRSHLGPWVIVGAWKMIWLRDFNSDLDSQLQEEEIVWKKNPKQWTSMISRICFVSHQKPSPCTPLLLRQGTVPHYWPNSGPLTSEPWGVKGRVTKCGVKKFSPRENDFVCSFGRGGWVLPVIRVYTCSFA